MERVDLVKNGFIRRKDLDFSDDGLRYYMYEYEGILVSKAIEDNFIYIYVKASQLLDVLDITYYDYNKTEWYKLCDEFNGVKEVNIEKLKENILKIKEGMEETKIKIANEVLDWKAYDKRADEEIELINNFIKEHSRIEINFLDRDSYKYNKLNDTFYYFEKLTDYVEKLKTCKKTHDRYGYKRFEQYHYICIKDYEDYYFKSILEVVNK